MASFVILLTARTARIACSDRHTDTQNDYCNPLCACAPRVNNQHRWLEARPNKMYICNVCIACEYLVLVLTVGSCACANSGLYSIVLVTNLVTFGLAHTWWVKLPSLVLVTYIIMQALHVYILSGLASNHLCWLFYLQLNVSFGCA